MGRTIIKLGVKPEADGKEKCTTNSMDQPVSTEVALSRVTGEDGCVVDGTMLWAYLKRKYMTASGGGEHALAELAAETASDSAPVDSKSIIYKDWSL
ncbi:hypothetical protein CUR178_08287 [Leishmania enriettii]|uniref:Uncharacterized protein n=1 Tax=Leishmania enriettii TaxID=5663 RepID=A0A836KUT8_LEIEN|nr:hypothetical protein CUR178_08287 [Leishmania enriettii]